MGQNWVVVSSRECNRLPEGMVDWRDWVAAFWEDCGAKLGSVGCRVDG